MTKAPPHGRAPNGKRRRRPNQARPVTEPIAAPTKDEARPPYTKDKNAETKRGSRKPFTQDYGMFLVTLAAAVAAFVAAGLNYQLLNETRASYVSVQRAFVTISPIESTLRTNPDGTRFWFFTTTAENTGNTPTRHLRFAQDFPCWVADGQVQTVMPLPWVNCSIFKSEGRITSQQTPTDPVMLLARSGSGVGTFALGPHAKYVIGEMAMPEDEIDRRANTMHPVYVAGVVRYRDAFPDTPEHITKYCFNIATWRGSDGEKKPVLVPCPRWNCTDEECAADN